MLFKRSFRRSIPNINRAVFFLWLLGIGGLAQTLIVSAARTAVERSYVLAVLAFVAGLSVAWLFALLIFRADRLFAEWDGELAREDAMRCADCDTTRRPFVRETGVILCLECLRERGKGPDGRSRVFLPQDEQQRAREAGL